MEQLDRWAGEFGDEYLKRNQYDPSLRVAGFRKLLPRDIKTALEVGSNYGNNLATLTMLGIEATGIEPNPKAIAQGQSLGRNIVQGQAQSLPFPDNSFDLVFTCGVLMHIPDFEKAMAEIWRVTRKYALAIEYQGFQIVKYHGHGDMLWKRPGYFYPGKEIGHGALGQEFDHCYYQLFEK